MHQVLPSVLEKFLLLHKRVQGMPKIKTIILLLCVAFISIYCQRQRPVEKKKHKITEEDLKKPAVWDTLFNQVPTLPFPIQINASTYFKGAIEPEYLQKFFQNIRVKVKEGPIEILTFSDSVKVSFYYVGKFAISKEIFGLIVYNATLQEFYCINFKRDGTPIDALEISKIHKREKGSEILEASINHGQEILLTYEFLSKDLKVADIPKTSLRFLILPSGQFQDTRPDMTISADSVEKGTLK